jgi:Fe-S-cluster-containing dehydrogenase component
MVYIWELGLKEVLIKMKAFVVDVKHCSGCYICQMACKDEHCGCNDWTPYAKPQPETGHFWGKLNEYVRGQVPQVKMSYVFVPCQHCESAPCIESCPVDGCIYTRSDGLVIIDPVKCTGCRNCIDACPYNCIYYNEIFHLAQKCTGCAHILDLGPISKPRCVDGCPQDAIEFGEDSKLELSNAATYHPEYGITTRVHYIGLPKRFIAGTVYDPNSKEVVEGATCTLSGNAGSYTITTDEFGDFWFGNLEKGDFVLTISSGSKAKTISGDTTEKDLGLGNIALS